MMPQGSIVVLFMFIRIFVFFLSIGMFFVCFVCFDPFFGGGGGGGVPQTFTSQ